MRSEGVRELIVIKRHHAGGLLNIMFRRESEAGVPWLTSPPLHRKKWVVQEQKIKRV